MSTSHFIADLHLGHEKTCTAFLRSDSITPLRPFASAEEMDEAIVQRWNDKIGNKDKVYVLGDVVIARRNLVTLSRLAGRKVLVPGNHDIFRSGDYLKYFEDIQGHKVYPGQFICSHIPLHPESITRFKANVHGHLHANIVKQPGTDLPDPRYLCVSVEQTDFTPISFDEVVERIEKQREAFGPV